MNVHYHVHSKPLQDPILKQVDVFHIHIFLRPSDLFEYYITSHVFLKIRIF